jgi:hypothetical protein
VQHGLRGIERTGQFAKRARSGRAGAVPGAYNRRTVLLCVSTALSPAPGAMPLVSSQRVFGTSTTSSGFCRPQTNISPAAGAHDCAGACACTSSEDAADAAMDITAPMSAYRRMGTSFRVNDSGPGYLPAAAASRSRFLP